MSRSGYGTVGGRRSGSAAWQWMVIGMIFATFCWAIVILALLTLGVLELSTGGVTIAGLPTPTPLVVTATTDPNLPSPAPVIITATLNPAAQPTTPVERLVVAPTATPTTDLESVQVEPSATPTPTPTTSAPTLQPQAVGGDNSVPEPLRDLVSGLVRVDGGTFQMGTTSAEVAEAVRQCLSRDSGRCDVADGEDSYPMHPVTIDPFQIEITEVTFAQYIAFLNWKRQSSGGAWSHKNGCDGQICLATRSDPGGENSYIIFDSANYDVPPAVRNFPAVSVTWYGAKTYCEAIGRRLPSEAEWERAARGSDGRIYPWGNEWDTTRAKTSRPAEDPVGAIEVGTRPGGVSPYGAYDMSGNVEEWVSDWYSPNFYRQLEAGQPNPKGPPTGVEKVLRGGSWDTVPFFARTVHRRSKQPIDQSLSVGFRCAADIESPGVSIGVPVAGTPNPATLGLPGTGTPTSDEEATSADDAAPTLPPAPSGGGPATAIPTLPPGG